MELDFTPDLPSQESLSEIARMAGALRALDAEIAEDTASLKAKVARRQKIAEDDLPTALDEAGIQSVSLSGGGQLMIKEDIYASIPKANKGEAATWLVDHGHASLVKTTVTALFDKGEVARAASTVAMLKAAGVIPAVAEDINTASVKAAIKEMRANGVDVPLALFGAFIKREAVIK